MVRRTLMRYLNLTLILVLRSISSAVKRRFPTLEHVVDSGFMTSVELEMFQSVPSLEFNTYWIPCTWFISLLKDCKKSQQIEDSQGLHIIMEEFNDFRSKCGLLWSYDWVSIPLVYTQVVTIATYSFFLAALVGRQYVDAAKKPLQMEIDIYLPVFTILQFFFFMGLLKVAEQLINPFGDDDEDFELNWLIDRHTKVSYLGVDLLMTSAPPLVKDMYFDQVDLTLPYTEAAVAYKKKTYRGSVHNMTVPEDKHTMFLPEISEEDEDRTPTPRSSLSNAQSMAHSQPCEPASATAAAAGTWRSQYPSTQSFHKMVEMDPEFESGAPSFHHVEVPSNMVTVPSQQKLKGVDTVVSESCNEGKATRSLSRSESVPSKRPIFSAKSMLGWPSSSTLARSDTSFRCSEQSIEMQSCYDSVSNVGTSAERTPEHEKEQFFSSVTTPRGSNRGDKFISVHGDGKEGRSGVGSRDEDEKGDLNDSLKCATDEKDDDSPSVYYNRLNVGLEVNCNHSPHLSEVSLETPPIPKQYEHYLCKPKDEYVTFRKGFGSACLAKVKSCPKLVFVKRQHSGNNGKKKGVRWKPMMNNPPGRNGGYSRRQTVEILPVTPEPSGANVFFPTKCNTEELAMGADIHCLWCRRQMEFRNVLLRRTLSGGSEQFVNTSADSVSNSSFSQELCPLHYRIGTNEPRKSSAASSSRLVIGPEILPSKSLPFQERRATVSTLSLTGSELEAKRWQSRSFWERGFFKKMKLLYGRKGVKAMPAVVKSQSLFISNKRPLSRSLPNLTFPHSNSGMSSATEQQTPTLTHRVMPTVRISDLTSTESEGSSCFASIMEMQEDEDSKEQVPKVTQDNKTPTISLNIPGDSTECAQNNNCSVSNNSAEHSNAHSQDSSWQSADWSGIIDVEKKCNSGTVTTGDESNNGPKEVSQASCEGATTDVSNTLEEVVIDSGSSLVHSEQLDRSVS